MIGVKSALQTRKYFPEPRKNIPNLLAEISSVDVITGENGNVINPV